MALPTSDRPAPPPSAATVKSKKGTGGTPTQIFDEALNPAAQYHARWDTPMPISSAEERRAPAPPPPAPAPTPTPSAVQRTAPTLMEALVGLGGQAQPAAQPDIAERFAELSRMVLGQDKPKKSERKSKAKAKSGDTEAQARDLIERFNVMSRDLLGQTAGTQSADDRRTPTTQPETGDVVSRFNDASRTVLGQGPAVPRVASKSPSATPEAEPTDNNVVSRFADTSRRVLGQEPAARPAPAAGGLPTSYGDERRSQSAEQQEYLARWGVPMPQVTAQPLGPGERPGVGGFNGLRPDVPDRAAGLASAARSGHPGANVKPKDRSGKGIQLENIPAPPSKRSGKRGGEGDTAKRTSRVERTPYDPATLKKAQAVLATAQALEAGDPGLMPNIDWDWVSEGGVSAPTPSLEEGSRWPDWMTPSLGFGSINDLPAIDISRGNMENFIPGIDIGWNTAGESKNAANQPITVEEAQKLVALAERAQRAHAIGADVVDAKPIPIHKQVDRMTWDEYNALSPRERAAVDSNAQVVNAVRTDRANKDKYGAPTAQYNATVEQMFGSGHGSETFAPAVVSYLDSIGFHDEAADLDDFLNLNAAIREQDIKHLDPTQGPVDTSKMSDVRLDRLGLATELSERTLASVDDVIRHGEQLKATFAASAKADRGDLTVNLGGVAPKVREMPGFGERGVPVEEGGEGITLDGYFQDLFARLVDKKQGPKRVQGDLAAVMANPDFNFTQEQANQFWEYVEARTAEASRYGQPLADAIEGRVFYAPDELRSALNMERINSSGQA